MDLTPYDLTAGYAGETESTFFRVFCMANNLKCMLAAKLLPAVLEQFAAIIDTAFTGSEDNAEDLPSAFVDNSEPVLQANEKKVSSLPTNLYQALLRRVQTDTTIHHGTQYCSIYDDLSPQRGSMTVLNAMAESLAYVKHRGKRFSTAAHCEADSHVIYRTLLETDHMVLGQVVKLFIHKRKCLDGLFRHQVFAVVRRYLALDEEDVKHDPYRPYPGLRASLVYSAPSDDVEVIPVRDIIAHFVACPYEAEGAIRKPCMVALPLDQVCSFAFDTYQ
ncbi:hypothetical protein L227DRAFT_496922 [Lentinus tigrinus ALCF2SS1-6]|uniref:Uncharacterized protein n=1 Tax=Lentinus tigrinus ALCF2SS1-6 TaxID=1328759 RepID=A0A5C2SQ66_9APHY|nr:hypothetical protein L227DRAFT_496922 [Lentinus tigrinus ALCF2SS1-6]